MATSPTSRSLLPLALLLLLLAPHARAQPCTAADSCPACGGQAIETVNTCVADSTSYFAQDHALSGSCEGGDCSIFCAQAARGRKYYWSCVDNPNDCDCSCFYSCNSARPVGGNPPEFQGVYCPAPPPPSPFTGCSSGVSSSARCRAVGHSHFMFVRRANRCCCMPSTGFPVPVYNGNKLLRCIREYQ